MHSMLYRYDFSHLVNKDESDESGKVLFSKSSNVTDASTCIKSHENDQNYGDPRADPEAKRHVTPVYLSARKITI